MMNARERWRLAWRMVRAPRLMMLDHANAADVAERRHAAALPAAASSHRSGFEKLFCEHVDQADLGCDFAFLRGNRGAAVASDYV